MSVERVLTKNGIEYKSVGSSYQVRCLSPDHVDNNPSMFVNKYSGWANCRSCGVSYNIFELFNEKADWLSMKKDLFRDKLRKVASDTMTLEFPETTVLWSGSYRGISAETLKEFQAFQSADFPGYISFPIRNSAGKIVNFIGRDTTGTRTPKYVLYFKRPILMYPNKLTSMGSIILVEGFFDMLNLYDKGITNVRAIFGTTTFSEEHINRLKIEGITEVIIMMDPDEAGRKASATIKEMLEKEYISTKTITLPSGTDPGDLSSAQVKNIKEQLYGKSSTS